MLISRQGAGIQCYERSEHLPALFSGTSPSITKNTVSKRIAHLSSRTFQNIPSLTKSTTPKRITLPSSHTLQDSPPLTKSTVPEKNCTSTYLPYIPEHSTAPESIAHPSTSIFPFLNPSYFNYKELDIGDLSPSEKVSFSREIPNKRKLYLYQKLYDYEKDFMSDAASFVCRNPFSTKFREIL